MNFLYKTALAQNFTMQNIFVCVLILFFVSVFSSVSVQAEEGGNVNLQETSHLFLIKNSQKIIDENFLLLQSVRYMYAKNAPIEDEDVYLLEKENKSFIKNNLEFEEGDSFSRTGQYMGKLRDIETFAKRDIVKELDIIGLDYTKRENYIDNYITLGNLLRESSEKYTVYFSENRKSLKSEISELQSQKKTLFKEYTDFIKDNNAKEAEKIEEKVLKISQDLAPKELAQLRYSIFSNNIQENNSIIEKRINAVRENKDALIKNVKVKLKSGEYIKIIEK